MRPALLIFARAPVLGHVKTRLAASIGNEAALAVHRELGRRVASAVGRDTRWSTAIAYTPATAAGMMHDWLGHDLRMIPQCDGGLGIRLRHGMRAQFQDGADRLVIVGSDCPDLTGDLIAEAFGRLDDADVVLGPAGDGGYSLVGLSGPHETVFRGIPWSAPSTLAATLKRTREKGLRVSMLEPLDDIDTARGSASMAGARISWRAVSRFPEIGRGSPGLAEKFFAWYGSRLCRRRADGA